MSKQYIEAHKLSKQNELFDLYNKDEHGKISISHIGDALRALGYYPSNAEINEIQDYYIKQDMEYIELNEFSSMCFEYEKKSDVKTFEDDFKKAIEELTKNDDCLDGNVMKTMLMDYGEVFSKEEVEEFNKLFSVEGKIHASDLVHKLVYKGQ